MEITLILSESRAKFLADYKWLSAEILLLKPAPAGYASDLWQITIKFPDYYNAELACIGFLGAGITYGLELQYNSYDNNIPR